LKTAAPAFERKADRQDAGASVAARVTARQASTIVVSA